MKPSEYLRDCVLFTPQVFFYKRKYSQAKNIADMYLTDSDAARWLTFYDYLMFVLMCAEDLENESVAKIVSATPSAPSEQ